MHLEQLLHKPAVISFKCYFIGFGDIDSDKVWIVLVLFTVHQALKENLDEF